MMNVALRHHEAGPWHYASPVTSGRECSEECSQIDYSTTCEDIRRIFVVVVLYSRLQYAARDETMGVLVR
jgi:hypothetical protein